MYLFFSFDVESIWVACVLFVLCFLHFIQKKKRNQRLNVFRLLFLSAVLFSFCFCLNLYFCVLIYLLHVFFCDAYCICLFNDINNLFFYVLSDFLSLFISNLLFNHMSILYYLYIFVSFRNIIFSEVFLEQALFCLVSALCFEQSTWSYSSGRQCVKRG